MNNTPAPCRVALVGLMGAGKTQVGRHLASRLGWPFWDTDRLVEERAGISIVEVFRRHGEPAFRVLEAEVLEWMGETAPPLVGALGGGVVEAKENRERLRSSFFVVWLDVTPETAAARVGTGKGRPLLGRGAPLQTLEGLYSRRRPWFEDVAHLTLDASASAEDLSDAVLRSLSGH
jgi:shikimate kinase